MERRLQRLKSCLALLVTLFCFLHTSKGTIYFSLSVFSFSISFNDKSSGAPNDGFLSNALKRCFRLSGVLLKL